MATKVDLVDGFQSKHFSSALQAAQQIGHLDLIFSANDGYADMVRTQFPSGHRDTNQCGEPMIEQGPAGIMHGLLRLLEELTKQGSVPAIDWSEYYSILSFDGEKDAN